MVEILELDFKKHTWPLVNWPVLSDQKKISTLHPIVQYTVHLYGNCVNRLGVGSGSKFGQICKKIRKKLWNQNNTSTKRKVKKICNFFSFFQEQLFWRMRNPVGLLNLVRVLSCEAARNWGKIRPWAKLSHMLGFVLLLLLLPLLLLLLLLLPLSLLLLLLLPLSLLLLLLLPLLLLLLLLLPTKAVIHLVRHCKLRWWGHNINFCLKHQFNGFVGCRFQIFAWYALSAYGEI